MITSGDLGLLNINIGRITGPERNDPEVECENWNSRAAATSNPSESPPGAEDRSREFLEKSLHPGRSIIQDIRSQSVEYLSKEGAADGGVDNIVVRRPLRFAEMLPHQTAKEDKRHGFEVAISVRVRGIEKGGPGIGMKDKVHAQPVRVPIPSLPSGCFPSFEALCAGGNN